jgi:Copper transport outer membrane protein, MctB
MINLRYHIVSLTAVFLAIGIGLTLGTSFLDRATVDSLESQLNDVEFEVQQTNEQNARLRDAVEELEERGEALREAIPERLIAGHLPEVPVLVIATEGTSSELVDDTVNALSAAGAEVAGTWWFTERWTLDDDDELGDLAGVVNVNSQDRARLLRIAAARMSAVLRNAAKPAEEAADAEATTTTTATAPEGEAPQEGPEPTVTPEPSPAPASEPMLIGELQRAGFIDYQTLDRAAESDGVLLPGEGVRYVVVSALPDGAGPQGFAAALVTDLAGSAPVPVLAAQGAVDLPGAEADIEEGAERSTFVGPIRDEQRTSERISTLDHLDTPAGLAALVLAVEDLGVPVIGHYGIAPAAARLLPAPVPGP